MLGAEHRRVQENIYKRKWHLTMYYELMQACTVVAVRDMKQLLPPACGTYSRV